MPLIFHFTRHTYENLAHVQHDYKMFIQSRKLSTVLSGFLTIQNEVPRATDSSAPLLGNLRGNISSVWCACCDVTCLTLIILRYTWIILNYRFEHCWRSKTLGWSHGVCLSQMGTLDLVLTTTAIWCCRRTSLFSIWGYAVNEGDLITVTFDGTEIQTTAGIGECGVWLPVCLLLFIPIIRWITKHSLVLTTTIFPTIIYVEVGTGG